MKSFSKEHKEQLSLLNVEAFKKECVENLESLELGVYGFPSVKEEIPAFVENGYSHVKKNYGLKTQKEIKMSLIAIYLGGVEFLHDQGYNSFLQDKKITNEQKVEFLEEYIDKKLDALHEEMGSE